MVIERKEFEQNVQTFLSILKSEDIYIMEKGDIVARLSHPATQDEHDLDHQEARMERTLNYY